MLWFTWALVGLFDVRFVTDSVFERVALACHLGVMIGFAVVAGNFHPDDQDQQTFQTMSICLMVSRVVLSCQYAGVIWHVRRYKKAPLPLALMATIHFCCAAVYLGLGFCFTDQNTYIYIAWYVIAGLEAILNILLSATCKVLSFNGTHLLDRMILLTFIIIGEGIIVICHAVAIIVKTPDSWSKFHVNIPLDHSPRPLF